MKLKDNPSTVMEAFSVYNFCHTVSILSKEQTTVICLTRPRASDRSCHVLGHSPRHGRGGGVGERRNACYNNPLLFISAAARWTEAIKGVTCTSLWCEIEIACEQTHLWVTRERRESRRAKRSGDKNLVRVLHKRRLEKKAGKLFQILMTCLGKIAKS